MIVRSLPTPSHSHQVRYLPPSPGTPPSPPPVPAGVPLTCGRKTLPLGLRFRYNPHNREASGSVQSVLPGGHLPATVGLCHEAACRMEGLFVGCEGGSPMSIELVRDVLLWCTLLNYGVLLWWFLFFTFAHDWMHGFHARVSFAR